MTSEKLAVIENVDLRSVWSHEAADFTPWLADHISELGKALGYDLELRQQEAEVGSFSLDILAHDIGRDRPVIIENQLEQTDHDHLGKLLTYASGFDASVIVWIAKNIREEHRQALDWLNQRTNENTEFFGVVVELLKIDNSRPALNFRLVAFPNEFKKSDVGVSIRGGISERYKEYQSFFQDLVNEIREQHKFTNVKKAQFKSFTSFSTGFSGIRYAVAFAQGGQFRVELYIDLGDANSNKKIFDGIASDRSKIEADIGGELSWERLDNRRGSRIAIYRPGTIDDDDLLEEFREWAINHLLNFKQVFGTKLTELIN